jgi:hypothetical protein
MLTYLRIAVTALSLTVCMLLSALWVRSYWSRDSVTREGSQYSNERLNSHVLQAAGAAHVRFKKRWNNQGPRSQFSSATTITAESTVCLRRITAYEAAARHRPARFRPDTAMPITGGGRLSAAGHFWRYVAG